MIVNNDVKRGGAVYPVQTNEVQNRSAQNWKAPLSLTTPLTRRSKGKDHRRLFVILSVLLLVMLILAAVRVMSIVSGGNDQLELKVGSQQQALLE